MSHAPDDYALVIGIDHYPKWANGRKSLKGAVNDAKDFHEWLLNPRGGGLSRDNARLVLSTESPVSPLQQIIDDEFKEIRERSRGKSRRRFYFYFSGHGHSQAMSAARQALCLANWSVEDQGAALQLESYLNAAVGCLGFEEGLFFLDCCRVREAAPLGKSSDLECGDPKFDDKHYVTFFATEHYKPGYEDGTDDVRGFFTRALLAILNKGPIEVADLAKRLSKDVADLAKPRNQTARALPYVNREIVLGPPLPPPKSDSLETTQKDQLAQLSISIDTNLTTTPEHPHEPPKPAPGEISIHRAETVVGMGRGGFSGMLPLGRYRVRIAHGEAIESHEIELRSDQAFKFSLPHRTSAALLWGTVDKQEVLTDPVVAASRTRGRAAEQSIFVTLRGPKRAVAGFGGSLSLNDARGGLFSKITGPHSLLPAQVGRYELLHDQGAQTTALPVPVAAGWDTQVFIVEVDSRLVLERASILMRAAGTGFDPSDSLIDAYELAVSDLVSGGPGPDLTTRLDLLFGKYRNPLFGLVGAHFLLRDLGSARDPTDQRYDFLDTVIRNMGGLLGEDSPDVGALRAGRARLREAPWTAEDYGGAPPLLRGGFLELIEATAERPELFGTSYDPIALGLVNDSPWTCWRVTPPSARTSRTQQGDRIQHHVEMKAGPRLDVLKAIFEQEGFKPFIAPLGDIYRLQAEGSASVLSFDAVTRLATVPDWVVEVMRVEIERSQRVNLPIDFKRIVPRTGLPRGLLEQAVRIAENQFGAGHAEPTGTVKVQSRLNAA